MLHEPPPKWGNDPVSEFIDRVNFNVYATFVKYPDEFDYIKEVHALFRESIDASHNTKHWFSCLFLLKAHSAFLASTDTIMGTQAQESYMLMRGALENMLYGYFMFKNPALVEVYMRRDENAETRKAVRDKFKIRAMIDSLKAEDARLCSSIEALYERVIDFGAHPNEKSLSSALKTTEGEGHIRFDVIYLTDNPKVIELALKTNTQVGIACLKILEKIIRERMAIMGLSERIVTLSKHF